MSTFSYSSLFRQIRNPALKIMACAILLCITLPMQPVTSTSLSHDVFNRDDSSLNGTILFAPVSTRWTYLVNNEGKTINSWYSDYLPGYSCWSRDDGSILRVLYNATGGVQIISWDGTITWTYYLPNNNLFIHHDAIPLPNGNILMIAQETKTYNEAVDAGRNPDIIYGNSLESESIFEVKPTGPTSGQIIWEWHVWDHLIQDYDASKANYGTIHDHPELININFIGNPEEEGALGWLHMNSVDYNQALDQILLSTRNNNEIWIIDHSTTTEQAASHEGGMYGHGGDLIYRWGNPQAYDRGTTSDRKLYYQHNAKWVKDGRPGYGHITLFNNDVGLHEGRYSRVDEIVPPLNENGTYDLQENQAYGPTDIYWSCIVTPLSQHLSSVERLPNGDTLICNGEYGDIYVVTPAGQRIWNYTYEGTPPSNWIFNACYIPTSQPPTHPDLTVEGSLVWTDITPGSTVTGTFKVKNIGDGTLNWTINTSNLNWGTWTFDPPNGSTMVIPTTVSVTIIVPKQKKTDFQAYIQIVNTDDPTDTAVVPVTLSTPSPTPTPIHPFLERIWNFLTHLQEGLRLLFSQYLRNTPLS
jgi:hypothetical protein